MTADTRLPLRLLAMSVLVHLVVVVGTVQLNWSVENMPMPQVTRYVMRFQQPVSSPHPMTMPSTLQSRRIEATLPLSVDRSPARRQPTSFQRPVAIPPQQLVAPIAPIKARAVPEVAIRPAQQPKARQPALSPTRLTRHAQPLLPRAATPPAKAMQPGRIEPVTPRLARHVTQPGPQALMSPPTAHHRRTHITPSSVAPPLPRGGQVAKPKAPSRHWQSTAVAPRQTPAVDADPLMAYLAMVSATLEQHKRYPRSARRHGMTGYVVLQFEVLADGQVTKPKVIESTGHAVFRSAALRTLSRAGRMPPFPPGIDRQKMRVEVPMAYKLVRER